MQERGEERKELDREERGEREIWNRKCIPTAPTIVIIWLLRDKLYQFMN